MNTLSIHQQQTVNKIKRTIQPRNPRKGPGSVSCFLLPFSQQNSCTFWKTTFFRAERSANINIFLLFPWLSNLTCSKRKGFTQFVKNRLYIASATQLMITSTKWLWNLKCPGTNDHRGCSYVLVAWNVFPPRALVPVGAVRTHDFTLENTQDRL